MTIYVSDSVFPFSSSCFVPSSLSSFVLDSTSNCVYTIYSGSQANSNIAQGLDSSQRIDFRFNTVSSTNKIKGTAADRLTVIWNGGLVIRAPRTLQFATQAPAQMPLMRRWYCFGDVVTDNCETWDWVMATPVSARTGPDPVGHNRVATSNVAHMRATFALMVYTYQTFCICATVCLIKRART